MLPAHFHDVTYDHILVKNTAGAHKEHSTKYNSNIEEQSFNTGEQATSNTELLPSITEYNSKGSLTFQD